MARQVIVHADVRELRRESILHGSNGVVYATSRLNTFKVKPWTAEQLEEARQRQALEVAYESYASRSGDDDMARQTLQHATIRQPAKVVAEATLLAAIEAVQNRVAGRPQGITEFIRGDEWNAFDPGVGGAKSGQRAIVKFLEENGFSSVMTTKLLAADSAPVEVLSYNGDIEELAEKLTSVETVPVS